MSVLRIANRGRHSHVCLGDANNEVPCNDPVCAGGDRDVVLADVHAVGVRGHDQVRPIVEDEQPSVLGAQVRKAARGRQHLLIGTVLHPQLHDPHAAAQRGPDEPVGLVIAHEVEPGRSQSFAV